MEKQIEVVYSTPSQATLGEEAALEDDKGNHQEDTAQRHQPNDELMWSCHCRCRQHITTDKIQLTVELTYGPVQ